MEAKWIGLGEHQTWPAMRRRIQQKLDKIKKLQNPTHEEFLNLQSLYCKEKIFLFSSILKFVRFKLYPIVHEEFEFITHNYFVNPWIKPCIWLNKF